MWRAWGAVATTAASVALSIYLIAISPWYLLPLAWAFAGTAWTGVRRRFVCCDALTAAQSTVQPALTHVGVVCCCAGHHCHQATRMFVLSCARLRLRALGALLNLIFSQECKPATFMSIYDFLRTLWPEHLLWRRSCL